MKIKIWSALVAVYLVWGATYLAIFYAVESLPPFFMGGIRFAVAGMLIFILRKIAGDPAPRKVEWRSATIVGLFLLVGGNGGVSWAEQYVASSVAALIIASVPLWMVLIDRFKFRRESIPRRALAGVLIGFAGILLLIGRPELSGSSQKIEFIGMLVLLLAAFSWAFGSVYTRDATLPASQLMGTSMFMLAGSVGLLLLGTLAGEWRQLELQEVTSRSWAALAYLIFFGTMIGFVAYSWLLRNAPISLVSTYAYVNPVVAVMLGATIASEQLNLRVIASTTIIILAVVLTNTGISGSKKPTLESALTHPGND